MQDQAEASAWSQQLKLLQQQGPGEGSSELSSRGQKGLPPEAGAEVEGHKPTRLAAINGRPTPDTLDRAWDCAVFPVMCMVCSCCLVVAPCHCTYMLKKTMFTGCRTERVVTAT